MKGFITYATYAVIENATYIQLFGRLENDESFVAQVPFTPYCYIRQKDLAKAKPLLPKYTVEKTDLATFDGDKAVRIESTLQVDLTKVASALHKKKINTYEADVKPPFRFMIDNDLRGSIEIEGECTTAERVDRVYTNPTITPVVHEAYKPRLNTIAIDIESSKKTKQLLCIGLYGEKYKKNFIIADEKTTIAHTVACKDEAELLERFKEELLRQDPDIITGWHVIDFDLAYLKTRFALHKIKFDLGRTTETSRVRVANGFFKDSTADISGRQVLDGLNLIRDPFIKEAPTIKHAKFDSYTLEDVSQALLGEGKILKGKQRHDEIERLFAKDKKKLVEYNLKDCELAYNIVHNTNTIDLAIERASLTGMPLNKITASIAAFDSLYIRAANKKGLVSPTTRYERRGDRIMGGYVMDSTPGIYHNLIVLDFKSLYPSIITTFNIDPSSFVGTGTKQKQIVEAPNGAQFKNQEGVLPEIIETLHAARELAKKENRELSSYAIKIIMNSFFGVLASPNCRYFSLDMGNAITHFARYIIQLTAKKIEEQGHSVIYSDTDSVFVETNKSRKEAREIGKNIVKEINAFFDKHAKDDYKRTSYLELEFEKLYFAFLMPPVRDSTTGSKKRYAGLLEKNGTETVEVVGLEAIRGDWTEAAQEFQLELLDKIFHKQEFVTFIRSYVDAIRKGKMDDKLVYRKSLRKPLEAYTKTTPPHVKAARKLDTLHSTIIEYYVTENGPEPIQKRTSKLDYEHYIKKQIAPIANTLLFFFDKTFDELTQTTKQMKLF